MSLSPVPRQPPLRVTGLTARPVSWRPKVWQEAEGRGCGKALSSGAPGVSDFTVGPGAAESPLSVPCSPCPVGPAAARAESSRASCP